MAFKLPSNLGALFANTDPVRHPVTFVWRFISRKGRPFLLLPDSGQDIRTSLCLYSPQRKRARIIRRLMPFLYQSPLKIWLPRMELEADMESEFVQFLARQAGVAPERLQTPAIKFGGVGQHSRAALLLSDETNRPIKVIKVGLNESGRLATDREFELLGKLPHDKLGWIRQTGRFSTATISAFATDYFPGASPADDAGMEILFHSWLNAGPLQSIETFSLWRELAAAMTSSNPEAWRELAAQVAGRQVRSTLYHGDFAPWNIRAINSQNLRVFDWERGELTGLPGWDWFHFVVQTAILGRRMSVERVAAELEQVLYSYRFKEYAKAAGIRAITKPLVLAYLLHQQYVVKPLEGGAMTARLYEFLAAHWDMKPACPAIGVKSPARAKRGASVRRQLKSAAAQWINLFWEPTLSFRAEPPLLEQFQYYWADILLVSALLSAIGVTQYLAAAHLMFLPLYAAACALFTWRTNLTFGEFAATVAATLGPIAVGLRDPGYDHLGIFLWNTFMRWIVLQMAILFTNRIREQKINLIHRAQAVLPPPNFTGNWAVLAACAIGLGLTGVVDYLTPPAMLFLPLYLFICTIMTLIFNLRWGTLACVLASATAAGVEYATDNNVTRWEAFGWNFTMRFLLLLVVCALLQRIREEHILFSTRHLENQPA